MPLWRGQSTTLKPRGFQTFCFLVFICLLAFFLFSVSPALADDEDYEKDPDTIIQEIFQANDNIQSMEADLLTVRKHPFLMRGILPPHEDIRFTRPVGIINFHRHPRVFNILLFASPEGGYFFNFFSQDGYLLRLKNDFVELVPSLKKDEQPTPRQRPRPSLGVRQTIPIKKIPIPEEEMESRRVITAYTRAESVDSDNNVVFNRDNPMHLVFPFYIKVRDPQWKTEFLGRFMMGDHQIVIVDVKSNDYGHFKLYVSNDDNRYIRRIDLLDPMGKLYARAEYDNFEHFEDGGWIFKSFHIEIDRKPVIQGDLFNIRYNIPIDEITGFKGDSYVPGKTPQDLVPDVADPARARLAVILTLVYLLMGYFGIRIVLFQKLRPSFNTTVILAEGRRAGKKISGVLSELGIDFIPFSQEILTREIENLQQGRRSLPRLLVVAPGAAETIRNFNYLIRSYVAEGGRVIFFEHDSQSNMSMPFTPVYKEYEPARHMMNFRLPRQWHHIFREFTPQQFEGRLSDFGIRSLLVKVREKEMSIEPIVVMSDPETNLVATPLGLVKERRGEYLVVQYRLFDYIDKAKNPQDARYLLRDIFVFMFGGERIMELAPDWVKYIMWIPIGDSAK